MLTCPFWNVAVPGPQGQRQFFCYFIEMDGNLLRWSLSLTEAPEILDPLLASTKTVIHNTTAGTAEDFQFTPSCTFQRIKGTINPDQGSDVKPGRSCPRDGVFHLQYWERGELTGTKRWARVSVPGANGYIGKCQVSLFLSNSKK